MRREAGVSVVAVVAVLAVLAAGGTGYVAWQNMAQVDQLQSELNTAKGGMDKARADLRKAAQDLAAAAKEAKESRAAAERLATERDAVRTSMENSQANGDRLRAELALAKDQISYLSARSSKDVVKGMPKVATSR
jgi:uncharacterized protein (DUF3084 family)